MVPGSPDIQEVIAFAKVIQDKIANSQPDWFVPVADVSPEVSINNDAVLSSLVATHPTGRPYRKTT